MTRRKIIAAIFLLTSATSILGSRAWADTFNTAQMMRAGAWESMYMYLGSTGMGRAVVFGAGGSDLAIDFSKNKCDTYSLTVIGPLGQYSPNNGAVPVSGIKVRIDDKPIFNAVGNLASQRGENVYYLSLFVKNSGELLTQIQTGSTIRLRIPLGGKFYYGHFSLYGSSLAIVRAHSLCVKHSDASYFNNPPPKKPAPQSGNDKYHF